MSDTTFNCHNGCGERVTHAGYPQDLGGATVYFSEACHARYAESGDTGLPSFIQVSRIAPDLAETTARTGDTVTATDADGHTYQGHIECLMRGEDHSTDRVYKLSFSFTQGSKTLWSSVDVRDEEITEIVRDGKTVKTAGQPQKPTEAFPPAQREKFEEIDTMEMELKGAIGSIACEGAGTPLFIKDRHHQNKERAQKKLYAAIDALSDEEKAAYGEYRKAVAAEIAAMR